MNADLRTRPLSLSDAKEIEGWFAHDPAGLKFVPSYRDVPSWLALVHEQKRRAWLLTHHNHNIGFLDLEKDHNVGYFSYYVAPAYRGQGYGAQMLGELELLARELRRTTLEGYLEPDNLASAATLRKAGYTLVKKVDKDGMIKASKSLTTL